MIEKFMLMGPPEIVYNDVVNNAFSLRSGRHCDPYVTAIKTFLIFCRKSVCADNFVVN